MSYVYVIQAEGGPVKVGVATDPNRRLITLRTGAPFKLSLAHVEPIADDLKAIAVEKAAHALLAAAHAHGEWYRVSPEKAREAIDIAISSLRAAPYKETISRSGPGLSAAQCRAARAMLIWPQHQVAKAAQISEGTVSQFEGERATPVAATLSAIRNVFEGAGVEFLDYDGVRLHPRS